MPSNVIIMVVIIMIITIKTTIAMMMASPVIMIINKTQSIIIMTLLRRAQQLHLSYLCHFLNRGVIYLKDILSFSVCMCINVAEIIYKTILIYLMKYF